MNALRNLPTSKLLLAALTLGGAALTGTGLPLWLKALGLLPAVAVVSWSAWKAWSARRTTSRTGGRKLP